MELVAPQETGTRLSKITISQVVAPAGTEVLHLYILLHACNEASGVRMRDVMSCNIQFPCTTTSKEGEMLNTLQNVSILTSRWKKLS